MRQRDLEDVIASAVLRAIPSERIVPDELPDLVHSARLAIHVRHFRASLCGVLTAIFPAVKRLTGEGFFAFAAAQFVVAHPPGDPILDRYGSAFPDFLAAFGPTAPFGWLPHVARFEWALHSLSQAVPSQPALIPEGYESGARARWSAAATLFAASYDVQALVVPSASPADCAERPVRLLLVARDESIGVHALDPASFAFLGALRFGATLSDAVATARSISSGFNPAPILRAVFERGAIQSLN